MKDRAAKPTVTESPSVQASGVLPTEVPALLVAWCADAPRRCGEVALFAHEGRAEILGRGEPSGGEEPVRWYRQRPGATRHTEPLAASRLSRRQLRVVRQGDSLHVEVLGRCKVSAGGEPVPRRATLRRGDTLLVEGVLLLCCVHRPIELPASRDLQASAAGPFGEADRAGIVGESPRAWALREDVAFAAAAKASVLVVGARGTGKALVARAIHAWSTSAAGPFVAATAASLEAQLEAELFGSAASYLHAGAPERRGLLEDARGGTLFVSDLGDLPVEGQERLLRAALAPTYRRLGDGVPRPVDARLVAATRDVARLGPGIGERFLLRVETPTLDAVREDIPLLANHFLRVAAATSPDIVRRFEDRNGAPRIDPALVAELLQTPRASSARELEAELWSAMRRSRGARISSAPATPGAGAPPARNAQRPAARGRRIELAREGDVWRLDAGGDVLRVKGAKGFAYLDHLLRHPNQEFFCLDLVQAVEPPEPGGASAGDLGDAGPLLDHDAKEAYRARLSSLREQLAEATEFADPERAARIRREIEALGDELSRAVGLGGRDRRAGSSAERARINVQRRLRDAIQRVEEHDAALGGYLARAIKTGAYCRYVPFEG